jgi:Flp pilus assembly protein TadG
MSRPQGFLSRFADDQRGVSAIVVGLSLSVILGFAGLAVDVGLWYADRRDAQGAADSAAYSAAVDYAVKGSVSDADATAQAVAAKYGFTNGSGGVTVTVNSPPTSGNYTAASKNAFEVIVAKKESLFFSALYIKAASIAARAVAVPGTSAAGGNYCMEILNSTPGASNVNFNISNGAVVDLSTCGIADDGPGSCAISASGGATITTQSLSVVGNYCTSNGATVTVTGTKTVGAPSVADPYASYSVSSAEGSTNMTCPNGTATNYSSGGAKYTLSPGVYCGGLSISNGVTVTMSPGIYYVVGGTFSLQGGTTTTANGVTIVLTGSGSNYATANIANGVNLNLTAPSTGPSAGIAIWADKSGPTSNTSDIAGGASMNVNGSLYFPTQTVDFSNGSSNSSACTQLVAYNVTFAGGANFTNKCASDGIKSIGTTSATQLVE